MKPIQGFEDYSIDEKGNVFSVKAKKYLKHSICKKGYCRVALYNKDVKLNAGVHRLVASNYIENPHLKPQVNHINGVKTDNRVENLEWATNQENVIHAIKIGLRDNAHKKAVIDNQKQVIDLQTGIFYDSLKIACDCLNINYGSARNCISQNRLKNFWLRYV